MENKLKPIIIQGAMYLEIEYLIENMFNFEKIVIGSYEFYKGTINKYPVIIAETKVGTVNAAASTAIAILEFEPLLIVNQGIAGSHSSDIHINDVIIGEKVININAFDIPFRKKFEGSNPFEWKIPDWLSNLNLEDDILLEFAKNIEYKEGKVYCGLIGSGDVWNKEVDRISWIHENYDTLCEDMESIATYTVCNNFNIPCIGIRIISNNEISRERYDRSTSITIQKFIIELVKKYIDTYSESE